MEPIVFEILEVERTALPESLQTHLNTLSANDDRFLYFKNAVLARAEVNRNKDEVSVEGLHELAATLPMTAIDLEHDHQRVIGFYTDARVADETLYTDGLIFKNRFPKEAEGIQNGAYRKSIEASAARAICSECGKEFTTTAKYCNHLKAKTAVRKLFGLKAEGGAATIIPAGTRTEFDPNGLMLIASMADKTEEDAEEEEEEENKNEGALRAAQRYMASVDLLNANPRAQTPLFSPVLAPFLWDPQEAAIKRLVEQAVSFSLANHPALQASELDNRVEASYKNAMDAIEKLRTDLLAKLQALEAAQLELQTKLQGHNDDKVGVLGIGNLNWISGSREEIPAREIVWG